MILDKGTLLEAARICEAHWTNGSGGRQRAFREMSVKFRALAAQQPESSSPIVTPAEEASDFTDDYEASVDRPAAGAPKPVCCHYCGANLEHEDHLQMCARSSAAPIRFCICPNCGAGVAPHIAQCPSCTPIPPVTCASVDRSSKT